MRTDDLIRTLAADNDWRARPLGVALAIALAAAAAVSLTMFAMMLGPRSDIASAMRNPFFDLKFAVTLSLAIAAAGLALASIRPGADLRRPALWLAVPTLLLIAGIVADLVSSQSRGWTARLAGTNARTCLTSIPALAAPLLVAAMLALRGGAAMRPALAGAAAGLLAGAVSAAIYAAHCTDDSPLFVATWYTLAIAIVTAAGALVGSRALRT